MKDKDSGARTPFLTGSGGRGDARRGLRQLGANSVGEAQQAAERRQGDGEPSYLVPRHSTALSSSRTTHQLRSHFILNSTGSSRLRATAQLLGDLALAGGCVAAIGDSLGGSATARGLRRPAHLGTKEKGDPGHD